MSEKYRIAGVNFDHMHMGDLLRQVAASPRAEIVGVCHRERGPMEEAIGKFALPEEAIFTDVARCLESVRPDLVILCPSTGDHADALVEVAGFGVHVLVEKPFAANLADADRMIDAMEKSGKQMMINWPLRWYPAHVTTKRLIDEGTIGEVTEVHYYDGNRGPLRHGADKIEKEPGVKADSWFYWKKAAGGSLQDYLGYGVTLGTWFLGGRRPIEVTTVVDEPAGLEVDEHSVTVARYASGLSKFETRWGTFTDPWSHQPQPKCGFVVVGTGGTISSYDFEPTIRVQTGDMLEGKEVPVDDLKSPFDNPVDYFLHRLEQGEAVDGPLSPAYCRIGQQIVDTAVLSAAEKRTVPLIQ